LKKGVQAVLEAIAFWSEVLRCQDLDFEVEVKDLDSGILASVARHVADQNTFQLLIDKSLVERASRQEIFKVVCHELLHALFWSLTSLPAVVKEELGRTTTEKVESALAEAEHKVVYKLSESLVKVALPKQSPKKRARR
jgi:hypothetical protein